MVCDADESRRDRCCREVSEAARSSPLGADTLLYALYVRASSPRRYALGLGVRC
jgi:hypothetical protein